MHPLDIAFLLLAVVVGCYVLGLVSNHMKRFALVVVVLLGASTAQAKHANPYQGYWYNPQPRHQHHVPPQAYNPYQYHSPYTYRAPRRYCPPQNQLYIQPKRTPNRSFYLSW